MAPLESRKIKATERLLLKYPASFETVNEFEQYMKDIALVTNPTPELTQQARAAFAKNMQQKQGNRTSIYNLQTRERAISKSLKYWLFDFAVLIAIVSVLISVFGIRYKQHESIQQDPVKPEVQVSTPCTPSTPMTQLYQVSDYVEVFDPSLNYPLRIPWEIKDIYTKDGIVKFQLQRMVSNRKSHLVLENVDASTIVKSQPYGRHTKAMCELDMKIHPCTVIDLENDQIPGGLYSVVFNNNGRDQFIYRPYWTIWRIMDSAPPDYVPSVIDHPLANWRNHKPFQTFYRD